jgi:hypothetical protein
MSRIMIRCPTLNWPVPTGLTTDMIKLDSMNMTLIVHCPACDGDHEWKQEDAWVEKEAEVSGWPKSGRD